MPSLNIPDFVSKWQHATLSERAAAQQHFIDICELLEQPRPADVDLEGNSYTFEKGLTRLLQLNVQRFANQTDAAQ